MSDSPPPRRSAFSDVSMRHLRLATGVAVGHLILLTWWLWSPTFPVPFVLGAILGLLIGGHSLTEWIRWRYVPLPPLTMLPMTPNLDDSELTPYAIYLDDTRIPESDHVTHFDATGSAHTYEWEIVRGPAPMRDVIRERGLPRVMSFDHDLGADEDGKDCARWVIEYARQHFEDPSNVLNMDVRIHSRNPKAEGRIRSEFQSFRRIQDRL